jgi:hypothetical protein
MDRERVGRSAMEVSMCIDFRQEGRRGPIGCGALQPPDEILLLIRLQVQQRIMPM